jgi:O-antigen/teichoic acid export membrane protein
MRYEPKNSLKIPGYSANLSPSQDTSAQTVAFAFVLPQRIKKMHSIHLKQPMSNAMEYMMSDNIINKLLKQVSMYFSSGVLVSLGGFLSFPIWTRVFTEAEYGQMSLAFVTLGLIVVLSKFGMQRAAIRFYSEFKENKRDQDIKFYYTTGFAGVLVISLIVAFIFIIFVEFSPVWKFDDQFKSLLRCLALLIIFEPVINIFLSFLRAEQNVKLHSIIRVTRRYSKLIVTLIFVLVFKLGLLGFFLGCVLSDGIFALLLFILFLQQRKIRRKNFSLSLLKESIAFGLPLIGLELSALLLTTGDRYLIQYFLGSAAVGIYSVSTNLTAYIVDFFAEALRLAVMPLFISLWEKKGEQETQLFLSSVFRIYFMIGIPIIFALSFIGRDLVILIASEKFEAGHIILPFIVTGYVIHKANFLYGAGLYIKKKTITLSIIIFGSAIINIILNIILIPIFGLLGAAMTTLTAYLLEALLLIKISFQTVSFKIPVYTLLKYIAISGVMVSVMLNINDMGSIQTILRMVVGFFVYMTGIIFLETEVRTKAIILLNKIFTK